MILITGANGSLGSYLVRHLVESGEEIRAMSHYATNNLDGVKGIEVVKTDIRFADEVYDAMRDCNKVYNLAALIHVDQSRHIPLLFYETNVRGTMNVLDAARRLDAAVVHMSSCEVLGNIPEGKATEDYPYRFPCSPYAASKMAAESYCFSYKATYGMRINVARGFNLSGPRQKKGEKGAVIPIFVDKVLHGEAPRIYGDGEQIRDYLDVRDLVKGLRGLMDSGLDGELIHFCSGVPVSINELAQMILKEAGSDLKPVHVEGRPGELLRSVGDYGKARRLLRWVPEIPLRDTIRDVVEFHRSML
jgi:UDP-glucose 4-epimerase